ncbi:hypothetical protein BCR39DRAFT_494681 [Naematelia encephala]|uniref:Uncharacterized protein n=1 Tax=Naematelia encephala TaxID=71784 RepID=A0A1Y2B7C2_9TREE|nr:hypothetical protein BCR39DRAFT_494681 [Naematelia encephala]
MAPPRGSKRRPADDDDRSPARRPKKAGKNKREVTYDTYDEALDGGVEMEEKGERYRDGDKAQRFYEKAIELYKKAYDFQQTYDAAYNQARALYTLSTSFLLPPESLSQLGGSVELYRQAATLTNSPLLQMDTAFNLAQALVYLSDLLEDIEGDSKTAEVMAMRVEAAELLDKVMEGQEEYLRVTAGRDEDEQVEQVEAGAENDQRTSMDVEPESGEGGEEEEEEATFETYLPTHSSFVDTALALVDVYLSIWEAITPPRTPSETEQMAVRAVLDRTAPLVPAGRQAELDFAEIKVLLSMDRIVWDLFKGEAKAGSGVEKSLEGATLALSHLLASLEAQEPDDPAVRAEILTTLADTHCTIAYRSLFLSPQLPPGPSPLAQQAWYHFSQAVSQLNTALELSTSAFTPKTYKPSVLLSLSRTSLARARLGEVNETAKRNAVQLMENASTYAVRAIDGLGWQNASLVQASNAKLVVPWPAGWDTETLARETLLQQLRVSFYGSTTDIVPGEKEGLALAGEELVKRIRSIHTLDAARALGPSDVERWVDEIEEGETLSEEERHWWKELGARLAD